MAQDEHQMLELIRQWLRARLRYLETKVTQSRMIIGAPSGQKYLRSDSLDRKIIDACESPCERK